MIVVETCAGLGNRLLGLASAYHWAKQNNEELVLIWKTEKVLGAELEALCTIPEEIKVIRAKDFGFREHPIAQFRYNMLEKYYKKKADYFTDVSETMDKFNELGNSAFETVMKEKELKFIRAFSQFHDFKGIKYPLDFIKPSNRVLKKAETITKKMDKNNTIGVHIRRADNQISINNSPLEMFIDAMNEEIAKNEKVTFYLASDDKGTIEEMKKIFGERIFAMGDGEKSFDRDNDEGIIDAYAELLCLSHSQKIIGSFYSTYSRIAAMISDIPLEVIKK